MKKVLLSLTIALGFFSAPLTQAGSDLMAYEVLIQKVMSVAWAPPEHTGTFSFQILRSGTVRRVDNKGLIRTVTYLSPAEIQYLETVIDSLPSIIPLVREQGNECMDVPSVVTSMNQRGRHEVPIRIQSQCLYSDSSIPAVKELANYVDQLDSKFSGILSPSAVDGVYKVGQEGHGVLEDPKHSRLVLYCEDQISVPDDGFAFKIEESIGSDNALSYLLTIHRSWLPGPVTETYEVMNLENMGNILRFESPLIQMAVATVSQRPDQKLQGTFIRRGPSGELLENRVLFCTIPNK